MATLPRMYLVAVLLRVILALVPLSVLHPDEFMQSVSPMAPLLLGKHSHSAAVHQQQQHATWDYRFTCFNATHPPHLPDALQPIFDEDAWTASMRATGSAWSSFTSATHQSPSWLRCPDDMQIQLPIRNVLFPVISCGLPYALYRAAWQITGPTSAAPPHAAWLLVLLPRISQLLLSLLTDWMLYQAAVYLFDRTTAGRLLRRYALALPTLVFLCRTFSNSFETTALAAGVWLASKAVHSVRQAWSSRKAMQLLGRRGSVDRLALLFGVLVGCGACVRLSFLAWAWPLGLLLVLADHAHVQLLKPHAILGRSWIAELPGFIRSAVRITVLVAAPCVLATAILVIADSFFFGTVFLCSTGATHGCINDISGILRVLAHSLLSGRLPSLRGSLLLTPLSNFLYNSSPANVAFHGTHPRYLHATVNMMLLIGPIVYARFLAASYRVARSSVRSRSSSDDAATPALASASSSASAKLSRASSARAFAATASAPLSPSLVDALLAASAWSGLLSLSLIPHQEARFLLPIIVPLALLTRTANEGTGVAAAPPGTSAAADPTHCRRCLPKWTCVLHGLHTVATVLLLGVLHQGGLLSTFVRPDLWRPLSGTGVPPSAAASSSAPLPTIVLLYKSYPLPRAFIDAHVLAAVSSIRADLHPPNVSLINAGDEASAMRMLHEVVEKERSALGAGRSTATRRRVLVIWPGSVVDPTAAIQQVREKSLPETDTRSATRPEERVQSDTGLSCRMLHERCTSDSSPESSSSSCVALPECGASLSDVLGMSFARFPHLSLDDVPQAHHVVTNDATQLRLALSLRATWFEKEFA